MDRSRVFALLMALLMLSSSIVGVISLL